MTTDKTLADAKPGGCVQLGDAHVAVLREMRARLTDAGSPARTAALDAAIDALSVQSHISAKHDNERFEAWAVSEGWERSAMHRSQGEYKYETFRDMWRAWQAALSAPPSPGGQNALVTDAMVMAALQAVTRETLAGVGDCDSKVIGVLTAYGVDGAVDIPSMVRAMLEAALAARQPVGEPDHLRGSTEMIGQPVGQISDAQIDARLNALYREMVDSGQHNGGMSGVAWDRAVFRMASKQPAQAVDLPYSLDADPAGIRARVADVITGTLMVGAQGHTPPPAGHWAQPFWQAARHDAARSLNVILRLRELVAASKYMRDRVVETRGVKCMDDLDYAINEADKALIDSQAVGNG